MSETNTYITNSESTNSYSTKSESNIKLQVGEDTDEDVSRIEDLSRQNVTRSVNDTRSGDVNDCTRIAGSTNKDYEYQCTHSSLEAAKKAIQDAEIGGQLWTRGGHYSTKSGDKIVYTCRSFPKCPRKLQVHLDPENQDVHIYMSTDNHDHDLSFKKFRLHPLSRQFALDMINNGCGVPRKIVKALEKNNLPPLSKIQINNLKLRSKTKVSAFIIIIYLN